MSRANFSLETIENDNTRINDYEELLLKRDQLFRVSGSYMTAYTQEFGDLITANFELKVECIKKKKTISYCRRRMNRGLAIDTARMQAEIDREMQLYYIQLKEMIDDNERSKKAGTISEFRLNRAKKIYRRLTKILHPDINKKTTENENLRELWEKIASAYQRTDVDALDDLEVLVRRAMDDLGDESFELNKKWYFLAPLLMDGSEYAYSWLESGDKLADYGDDEEKSKRQKGFNTHLATLRALFDEVQQNGCASLGKQPDDLVDVLTDMAIAAPAICINRTYRMYLGEDESLPVYLPSQLARVFLNRMNSAESTAVVELACGRKSDDAHWQNMLTYCKHGNLQAVFDEYTHLIASGTDRDEALIEQLHRQMVEAMDIRTTQYNVDTFKSFQKRMCGQKDRPTNIRTHFAVAFTKGEGKESDTDRKKTIRNAFNSPFRPFVLATTSIGQEGLDFHNYCRKIVHWNLPSNPIDVGRILRTFKIKKNVEVTDNGKIII